MIKHALTLLLVMLANHLFATDFITRWDLSIPGSGTTSISFGVGTTGTVGYTWETVPTGLNGSGTFSGTTATITGLPAGSIIRLKIDTLNFNRINIDYGADKDRLLNVEQWGDVSWSTMKSSFSGCINLNITSTDMPDLSLVDSMTAMFANCQILNGPTNINNWNTSNVIDMSHIFNNASSFNQPIDNWSTSNVINMWRMLSSASSFNQPIGNWNTSNVTNMTFMFSGASSFNQPIGNWNTINVTSMNSMLRGASSFNQPIGSWNTSNVLDMEAMFWNASSFNQPISNWNTSKVTNMGAMFADATSFNQPIGNWVTDSVFNMSDMFYSATSFNQPIGNWNTGSVTNFTNMFREASSFNQPIDNWNISNVTTLNSMFMNASSFNQPLGNWNTSSVTNMSGIFRNASSFNQPIGNWNTNNVTTMGGMFWNANSFNQPVGNWNTSNVTNMFTLFANALAFNHPIGNWILNPNVVLNSMLENCGIDCSNYSATINGWASNPLTPNNRVIGVLGLYYGINAQNDRSFLDVTKGWTIVGDALSSIACCFTQLSNDTLSACNSFLLNGQTYLTSGIYTDTLISSFGCDSIVTLNLTINNSSTSTMNLTACNSFAFKGQILATSGTYYDTLVNATGCDSIITLNLIIDNIDTTVMQNGTILNSNENGVIYQWLTCPTYSIIMGATNQSYTATSNGDYAVSITKNTCIDTSNCLTVAGVGISNVSTLTDILITPNPTNGLLIITFQKLQNNSTINISNSIGQTTLTKELSTLHSNIDISTFASGIYYIEIIGDNKTYRTKLLKN